MDNLTIYTDLNCWNQFPRVDVTYFSSLIKNYCHLECIMRSVCKGWYCYFDNDQPFEENKIIKRKINCHHAVDFDSAIIFEQFMHNKNIDIPILYRELTPIWNAYCGNVDMFSVTQIIWMNYNECLMKKCIKNTFDSNNIDILNMFLRDNSQETMPDITFRLRCRFAYFIDIDRNKIIGDIIDFILKNNGYFTINSNVIRELHYLIEDKSRLKYLQPFINIIPENNFPIYRSESIWIGNEFYSLTRCALKYHNREALECLLINNLVDGNEAHRYLSYIEWTPELAAAICPYLDISIINTIQYFDIPKEFLPFFVERGLQLNCSFFKNVINSWNFKLFNHINELYQPQIKLIDYKLMMSESLDGPYPIQETIRKTMKSYTKTSLISLLQVVDNKMKYFIMGVLYLEQSFIDDIAKKLDLQSPFSLPRKETDKIITVKVNSRRSINLEDYQLLLILNYLGEKSKTNRYRHSTTNTIEWTKKKFNIILKTIDLTFLYNNYRDMINI